MTITSPPAAVWLDLFGTLVRTPDRASIATFLRAEGASPEQPWWDACLEGLVCAPLFSAAGVELRRGRALCLTRRLASVPAVAAAVTELGGTRIEDSILQLTSRIAGFVAAGYAPAPGAMELLGGLGDAGVPIAIVSNADAISLDAIADFGLSDHIEAVFASCDTGETKPRAFELAAGHLGVAPSDSVAIGDNWTQDVLGPLRLGARAIWIDHGRDPVATLLAGEGPEALLAATSDKWSRETLRTALKDWLPDQDEAVGSTPWHRRISRVRSLEEAALLLEQSNAKK